MSPNARSAAQPGDAAAPAAIRCWHCDAPHAPALFCPRCESLQPLPPNADHFTVLGFPRRLTLDPAVLQQRFYDLNRRLHPDRFQTAPREVGSLSVRNTAAVNTAYRTLRDPVERGWYWLALHGERIGTDKRVAPDIAALVFELQEKLEALRSDDDATLRAEVARDRNELAQREAALLGALHRNFGAWDGPAADPGRLLRELRGILSSLAYLRTLMRDVDRQLEQ